MLKLAHWFNEMETSGFKSFSILKNTITHHYNEILNYFEARSTNASAESFNAKNQKLQIVTERVKDKAFSPSDYPNFLPSPQILVLSQFLSHF